MQATPRIYLAALEKNCCEINSGSAWPGDEANILACAACPGNHVASVLRVRVKDSLWISYWKPQVRLRLHCSKEARVTVHKRRFFFLKVAKYGLQLDLTLVCFATHATSWLATPCVYFDTDCCNRVYASNELVSEC